MWANNIYTRMNEIADEEANSVKRRIITDNGFKGEETTIHALDHVREAIKESDGDVKNDFIKAEQALTEAAAYIREGVKKS